MARLKQYSTSTRINAAARAFVSAGWDNVSRGKHGRLRSPDGKTTITVPLTPSDWRSEKNWFSQLSRSGIEVPA